MHSLKLESIFFEALNYPEYARPNFFVIKQRQSQWHKGVYLNTLAEVYHKCFSWVDMHYRAQKNKNSALKLEDIEIQIKDITKGDEIGTFNKEKLDQLFLAVEAAFLFDNIEIEYSDIEILSFVEYALWFIRNEFKIQTREIRAHFRPQTKSYFIYEIIKGDLFFNFPRFKHAVRELFLFAPNKDNLKEMLRKYYTASREIVDLWNNKIFLIEEKANRNEKKMSPEMVRVEFKAEELKHTWWNDTELFNVHSPTLFRNQDFASYAVKITNLLSTEILDLKSKNNSEAKKHTNLEDLFIDKKEFEVYVEILRKINPVAISPKNEFLLGPRNKGVFVAWIDALKEKGKIYPTNRKILSTLISNYFKGVDFGKDGKNI